MADIVIAVTGASGSILAIKLIKELIKKDFNLHLVVSKAGICTYNVEVSNTKSSKFIDAFSVLEKEKINRYSINDYTAKIASGSFIVDAMVILPCSMTSLAAISIGLGDNLIRRAADVTIKEGRKLILVPREIPFSSIHLENMLKLSNLGAIIIPPIAAWYNKAKTLDDIENFIVGKILDSLKIENNIYKRWS